MSFYDLSKEDRIAFVEKISTYLISDIKQKQVSMFLLYFSDEDTYIRKSAYLCTGRIYRADSNCQKIIIDILKSLYLNSNYRIRQTVINAAGEIGILDFDSVQCFFDLGLKDSHHAVRNAVIGSLKKMGEKNPVPVIAWSELYILHPDKEIRREICHGLELYGRKHPDAILPLLKKLQYEKVKRVRNMLIHVIGQISYKKGCLEKVIQHLNTWENDELVKDALQEILAVHENYKNFAVLSTDEAAAYIDKYSVVK